MIPAECRATAGVKPGEAVPIETGGEGELELRPRGTRSKGCRRRPAPGSQDPRSRSGVLSPGGTTTTAISSGMRLVKQTTMDPRVKLIMSGRVIRPLGR